MDYYKRYMGDYGRDTSRLSMTEHGAYSLLLDDYYSTRSPLPADLDALYRICRAMSKQEQAAVKSVANHFFPVGRDGLRHSKRADEEIAKWEELTKEASESGKRGAEARWGKTRDKKIADPMRTPSTLHGEPHADPNADPIREAYGGKDGGKNGSPAPIPNPNPETRSHSHAQERAREGANGSLPDESAEIRGDDYAQLVRVKTAYPQGIFSESDWLEAQRYLSQRIDAGATWDELVAGAERYAAQQRARGKIGTEFIESPKRFFAQPAKFREAFPLPTKPTNGKPAWTPPKSADEIEAEERARDQH